MRSLRTRVERLEDAGEADGLRPVLLVTSQSNVEAELQAWQERYGPCDAEPLLIALVAVKNAPRTEMELNVISDIASD